MSNALMDALAIAAARGIEVTVITNDSEPPPLRFKWNFRETSCTAIGRYRAAGYDLVVQDCDGDWSWWELRRGRDVLAKGEAHEWEPYYHFDACLMASEAALMAEVRRRLAKMEDEA